MVRCHALQKCSTIELYYITSPPHEVPTSDVMSALITLSKQISDGKLASNRPHPMDLCAQFIKTLAKKVDVMSFETTPNMSDFPFDNTLYMTTSAVENLIKANGTAEPSESSLMKYFKQLDEHSPILLIMIPQKGCGLLLWIHSKASWRTLVLWHTASRPTKLIRRQANPPKSTY